MKVIHSLNQGTRNTHAVTLSIARSAIARSDIPSLEAIASKLEDGLRNKRLNAGDARALLCRVRREIAERHFQ